MEEAKGWQDPLICAFVLDSVRWVWRSALRVVEVEIGARNGMGWRCTPR
jgi:hypothetical protein